jgi:LPS sulfotransferase NodH
MAAFPIPYRRTKYDTKMNSLFNGNIEPLRAPPGFEPIKTFVICFSNRCGSNFLAAALASTGKFPRAGEYFNEGSVRHLVASGKAARFGEVCLELAKQHMLEGAFATKLAWAQLYFLTKTMVIPSIYGMPKFILITRRDLLDQAISYSIAYQTKVWTSEGQSSVEPVYDQAEITTAIRAFALAEAHFRQYFAAFNIVPYELTYEDLVQDPETYVNRISEWLGLEVARMDPSLIRIQKQSGALNSEWRDRYLHEAESYFEAETTDGRSVLPPRFGRMKRRLLSRLAGSRP